MTTKIATGKHRKPKGQEPSQLVLQYAEMMASNTTSPIADVACGYGRNAIYLAEHGCEVFCLDNSPDALSTVDALKPKKGKLTTFDIDLSIAAWPYQAEVLSAIVNVHYFNAELLPHFIKTLRPGGFLLIETIDNRGGNYLYLPRQGFIREHLQDAFNLILYQEKKAGPAGYDAVTVKVFARKHYTEK